MIRKNRWVFIPALLLLLAGTVVGIFYDYQINEAIYSLKNLYSTVLASIGEFPTYGSVVMSAAIIFGVSLREKKHRLLFPILAGIFMVFAYGMLAIVQGKTIMGANAWGVWFPQVLSNTPAAVLSGLLAMLPWLLLGLWVGKKADKKSIILIAVMLIVMSLLQLAVINVIKGIFHRPRFRYLMNSGQVDLYHAFGERFTEYKDFVNGVFTSEEFKSFPSGHTGSAAVIVMLLSYLPYLTKGKVSMKHQKLLFFIGFLYTLALAFSRMLCGAHYLTDVCVGGFLSILICMITDFACAKLVAKHLGDYQNEARE